MDIYQLDYILHRIPKEKGHSCTRLRRDTRALSVS